MYIYIFTIELNTKTGPDMWTGSGEEEERGVWRGRETEYNGNKDNKSNNTYDGKNLMIDKILFCVCVCEKGGHWMYSI